MSRPSEINRFAEMEVFAQVAERGGFSAAARALGMTPSAVSKLVARLEARLEVRLVNRSTRHLALTAEGSAFHERSLRLLAELRDLERAARSGAGAPRGRVSVHTSHAFGAQVLAPLVPALQARHPAIALDIVLGDRVVDLVQERADIAVRWGPLPPSGLVARPLGETEQVIVAAPAYLAAQGTPRTPDDLDAHRLLGFTYRRRAPDWPLRVGGRVQKVSVRGDVRASDGEALRLLALAGAGLVRLSRYHVQADLDAGRLLAVLERFNPREREPLHAVCLARAERLPARVRAVLDFLAETLAHDARFAPRKAKRATAR